MIPLLLKTELQKKKKHLSNDQNPLAFHYTGCLIGIFMVAYEIIPG